MTRLRLYFLFALFVFAIQANAETVHIPDSNLRMAVHEALNVATDLPLDRTDLARLTQLDAHDRGISSLVGLEFAESLEGLSIWGNPISDLTPVASLINLKGLHAAECQIVDLRPLSHLPNLAWLHLRRNKITTIEPLATLPRLKTLIINHNPINDYNLPFTSKLHEFIYDQICDVAPEPLLPRLTNQSHPSVFSAWGSPLDYGAKHNLWLGDSETFALHFRDVTPPSLFGVMDSAISLRETARNLNPNLIILVEIRMFTYPLDWFPEDWPHWLRDANGRRFIEDGRAQVHYAHPEVQRHIIERALAVSRCGLFDGIFIDHWVDNDYTEARLNILRGIQRQVRPDFIIIANTNDRTSPLTAPYINGSFMENPVPGGIPDGIPPHTAIENYLRHIENVLTWNEVHMREPRLNCFESRYFIHEPPNSPLNLRWMRAMTTLNLTHSNGYLLFSSPIEHHHIWYDFWDADLGRPVGEKRQLYQEIEGLYIREFTNGWAVYNHSGAEQQITLPEEVQGVASGWVNTEHALPNLDGEMYLRVTPKNPADVNGDGVVNIFDLTLVAQALGTDKREGDVNGDGAINVFDLVFVAAEIQ